LKEHYLEKRKWEDFDYNTSRKLIGPKSTLEVESDRFP
jgi:hypothetical protein